MEAAHAFEFLVQAYLHQDWMMDGETLEDVLAKFAEDSPPPVVEGARSYAAALVDSDLEEAELEHILDRFGIQVDPSGLGMTHRALVTLIERRLAGSLRNF